MMGLTEKFLMVARDGWIFAEDTKRVVLRTEIPQKKALQKQG
jgi:hypothetical protein